MRKKSLTVIKKVKEKRKLIKDIKVKKFYQKFEDILNKNTKKDNIALAISGGSDSLSLAYFGKIYKVKSKKKVHFIIVNHKIRKEATKESLVVKKILKQKGIIAQVLSYKGKTPKNNIQKNARDIRYSLISNYCFKKNIKYLITAHHLDDQIENFFIRLIRGSGLTGLSSMAESVSYNENLKIIRPFLDFKKEDLKFITLSFFSSFIQDPSNKDEKFLRVRVRKYRENMEKEGLDTSKIIKTVKNLLSANKALNYYKNKALYKHVSFLSENKCSINTHIFSEEATEIIFKSFSDILSLVSGTYYPPRSKKVTYLIDSIKKSKFKKSTLGGCIIEKKDSFILVSKEPRLRKTPIALRK